MFGFGRAVKAGFGALLNPSTYSSILRGKRKTAVFYGACHAIGISKILEQQKEFRTEYEVIVLPANFLIAHDQLELAKETVAKADLFVYQPYTGAGRQEFSSANLLRRLKPSAKVVTFAYPHCEIYQPFTQYPSHGMPKIEGVSYVDYAFGRAIIDGVSIDDVDAYTADRGLLAGHVEQLLAWNLTEARARETRVLADDLPIQVRFSDIVEKEFRSRHLFLSLNHPSVALLNEVARRICEHIPLPFNPVLKEVLPFPVLPIASHVRTALGLNFTPQKMQPSNYHQHLADYFRTVDPATFEASVACMATSRPWFKSLARGQ